MAGNTFGKVFQVTTWGESHGTGIGAVIAGRVIEYRFKFGPFRNSDDIKKVKGIGNKKIKAIRKYITF